MKYKLSKYNHLLTNDDSTILYNCISDVVLALVPQLTDLLTQYADQLEQIEEIHEEFFQVLKEKRFIVPEFENEIEVFIDESAPKSHNFQVALN